MSTRSSTRNLFPSIDNPELTIRRRPRVDPTPLNDFNMATNGNGDDVPPAERGDLPVPDLQTVKELYQPTLNGRGGPIAPISIQAMNFGLKNDMIQQVQNSCQFHGLPGDDANKHIDKFLHAYQAPAYQAPGYQALVHQALIPQPQVVTTTEFTNYLKANDSILKNMKINMTSLTNSNLELKNMFGQLMKMNTASSLGSKTLPSNTITNPKEDLKGITTRSGITYKGPTIPTISSPPKVVERETEVTKDTVPPTNNRSTKDVQPSVIQIETQIPNSKPVVAPVVEPVEAPKLFELARTPLNEHCALVLLKKLPEKLGDPDKFLIPCDFPGMNECLALAVLGVIINLMPLSIWNNLSLLKLSPTCMILELADRSISRLVGVTKDVFVKVGTFHFSAVFVVVDIDADPQVPLILERSFLKTGHALIDVYEGELTLCVGNKAITFNLDQSSRYSANYDDMSDLPPHLEYSFLEGDDKLLVIIAKDLKDKEKPALIKVLKSHKQVIAWKLFDIKGINSKFYTHKILMEDDFKPAIQHQRRVNPKIHEMIKKEVLKLLDVELIYPMSDSPWVRPLHCVPKKGGFTVVENKENELIPTRLVTDFLVFGNSFKTCLSHLEKRLRRCEDTNLCLNWEKSHFMVKEGIVLGHKISKNRIKADKAKVDVIAKLPHLTTIMGAENLAADHLSRLENPHQNLIDKKEINEMFPLETLNVIKSSGGVFTARKPLIFLRLATMDPPGDITARTTLPKRCLTPVSTGPQSIVMPMTWSNLMTLVNVREKFRNVMKCLKTPSKFARFLTFGTPHAIISDRGTHFCNDQFAKVMVKYGVTHCLATAYHPQTNGQVEVSNRGLKRIMERTICKNHASWSVKLDDTL
uniref:Integrase catalytic domain-containing protein n=1 Tax=Tanacetum cinerariifolium TaxID=118510 RepID=A0A699H8X9_TANCI|nr:hypothetical protein [Tanacetum cinerariifolium]